MVRRGFPQARAVKGLFSVCNEANTGDSRQAKSFLPRPCSAVEVGRAESTDIPQGSGDKNQRGPRDEWGAWGGMQMIFSNNKNKKTKKERIQAVCSCCCLRPLVSRGVVGHCGILWQAVPRKIAVLGLPAGRVPPCAAVPLVLSLLEASTSPSVDFMYLRDKKEDKRRVSTRSPELCPCRATWESWICSSLCEELDA